MSPKVLYIAMECKPYSKSGGVGDVAGELPAALIEEGAAVEVVTPAYGPALPDQVAEAFTVPYLKRRETVGVVSTRSGVVPVLLLTNRTYFGTDYTVEKSAEPRFDFPHAFKSNYAKPYVDSPAIPYYDDAIRSAFLSEACLEIIRRRNPDVVHINDWPLGYLFGRMIMEDLPQYRVLTVHNTSYQGNIGRSAISGLDLEEIANHPLAGPYFTDPRPSWSSVNALRLGMELANQINTVSPTYKMEMTQPEDRSRYFEGGKGLEFAAARMDRDGRLHGILNGFQYSFEPTQERFEDILSKKAEAKRALSQDFRNPHGTLLGFVGRAVEQKFKLLTETIDGQSVLERILTMDGVNVAIVATGLPEYEAFLRRFHGRPNFVATLAFDRAKAGQINLGSDLFLMPSLFEPCGITQMESLSYATPPIVRLTGGLVDTVLPHPQPMSTGFGFDGRTTHEILHNLVDSVRAAVEFHARHGSAFRELQWRGFQKRFLWSSAAREYMTRMYRQPVGRTIRRR